MMRLRGIGCTCVAGIVFGCSSVGPNPGDDDAGDIAEILAEAELDDGSDVGVDAEADDDGVDAEILDILIRDVSRDESIEPDFGDPIPLPPTCGDGVIGPGEECDDGNRRDGDGCDWQCRLGFGTFEYPPPDPAAPRIEPTGAPTRATAADEIAVRLFTGYGGSPCGSVRLRAGAGRYALAYDYDHPSFGVRLRVVSPSGAPAGDPWDRATFWLQALGLAWDGDRFALFTATSGDDLSRSRFDPDGTVVEEMLRLRGPHPYGSGMAEPTWEFGGVAWHEPVWLVTAVIRYRNSWSLETYRADGSAAGAGYVRLLDYSGSECVDVAATPDGFAVADGDFVVAVDTDLDVIGWSGWLRSGRGGKGAVDVAPDGVWVAWQEWSESGFPGRTQLWVGMFDFDGSPRFPSRVVHGPYYRPRPGDAAWPTDAPEVAISHGPAGAAIVFWEGRGEEAPGGWVKILTVDNWGNVITPAQLVLDGEGDTPFGWVLATDADDEGYGVVTAVPGDVLGTMVLVFRHYAVVP